MVPRLLDSHRDVTNSGITWQAGFVRLGHGAGARPRAPPDSTSQV